MERENESSGLRTWGDREGVVRLLEYHLKRLDMEIEKRTAETSEKKKLGSWLGAAGGIFLVILLL